MIEGSSPMWVKTWKIKEENLNFLKTDLDSWRHKDSKNIFFVSVRKNFPERFSEGTVFAFQTEYFGFSELIDDEHKYVSHIIYLVFVATLFWLMDRQVRLWTKESQVQQPFLGFFGGEDSKKATM